MHLRLFLAMALLIFSVNLVPAAESYEQRLAETNRQSPDSLYELVLWCRENQFHARANQHIREILALDPNHAPTRELQGFVWDGRRWVHQSRLPGGGQQGEDSDGRSSRPAGPPPKAEEIEWDLQVPPNPDTEETITPFLQRELAAMNRGQAHLWATLMIPAQRETGLSLLKAGIADGSYTDLQVPIAVADALIEEGNMAAARRLLPFMVKASERNTKPDDLALFAYHVSQYGDKRVFPRLLQLLDHPDEDVQFNTKYALGQFMHRSIDTIDKEGATDWWARFHNAPDSVIYAESLKHRDPMVRLSAVTSITRSDWTDDVMPVLIGLVREDDRNIFLAASRLLVHITGSSWDLSMTSTKAQRESIANRLEEWWGENRGRFRPVFIRQQTAGEQEAAAPVRDRIAEWVQQLGDLNATVSGAAINQIRGRGEEAIPQLINHGLSSNDGVTRNRSRDLLREISGQNFGFEGIRGDDAARSAAIARWRQWASEAGHLGGD